MTELNVGYHETGQEIANRLGNTSDTTAGVSTIGNANAIASALASIRTRLKTPISIQQVALTTTLNVSGKGMLFIGASAISEAVTFVIDGTTINISLAGYTVMSSNGFVMIPFNSSFKCNTAISSEAESILVLY